MKKKITVAAGMATLAALTLTGCASPFGNAFGEAPATTAAATAPVAVPSATPTATTVAEVELDLPIDGQRPYGTPALGTVTIDLSDSTLTLADSAGLPVGAPMPVTVTGSALPPVTGDVGRIYSAPDGMTTAFTASYWLDADTVAFVEVRANTEPAEIPADGSFSTVVHVAPAAWDAVAVETWAFGAAARGDLTLNIVD